MNIILFISVLLSYKNILNSCSIKDILGLCMLHTSYFVLILWRNVMYRLFLSFKSEENNLVKAHSIRFIHLLSLD